MGNIIGRLNLCFTGEISRQRHDIPVNLSDPLDEGLGHSFCYVDPSSETQHFSSDDDSCSFATATATITSNSSMTTAFHTISGASISANTSTPLSTADDKVTVLEAEKRAWESSPEAKAIKEALNPWRNHDAEPKRNS